jgi:hypothetical protein
MRNNANPNKFAGKTPKSKKYKEVPDFSVTAIAPARY